MPLSNYNPMRAGKPPSLFTGDKFLIQIPGQGGQPIFGLVNSARNNVQFGNTTKYINVPSSALASPDAYIGNLVAQLKRDRGLNSLRSWTGSLPGVRPPTQPWQTSKY